MLFRTPARQALADQVLATLASSDGFPLSTGQLTEALGVHLVTVRPTPEPPLPPRPACWPQDLEDPGTRAEGRCVRCRAWHRGPVWQAFTPDEIRSILARLATAGTVERVVLEGWRSHYWRHTAVEVDG
jgi:hypothetical protein